MQILHDEKFLPAVIMLLRDARRSIDISTFKAELTDRPRGRRLNQLFDLVIEKSRVGLPVRFLLSKSAGYGHIPRCNLLAVRALKKAGVKVRHLRGDRLCHTKLIIIDGDIAILGSHNLGIKSVHSNFEISLIVTEPNTVCALHHIFNNVFDAGKQG